MAPFDRFTWKGLQDAQLHMSDEMVELTHKVRAAGDPSAQAKLVEATARCPEYISRVRGTLRGQYGDTIQVYRGGRWYGDYIAVTTDIDKARMFARDRREKNQLFRIRTDDVLALGDTADCELIVRTDDLMPRFKRNKRTTWRKEKKARATAALKGIK